MGWKFSRSKQSKKVDLHDCSGRQESDSCDTGSTWHSLCGRVFCLQPSPRVVIKLNFEAVWSNNLFMTSESPKYSNLNSPNLFFNFFNESATNNLRQILDWYVGKVVWFWNNWPYLKKKKKNHNKRFGGFEFEYFGDSDVVNKLLVYL